jgi:hypothetical protein
MAASEESLEANRAGRLSPSQLSTMQKGLKHRNRGLWGRIRSTWDPFTKDVEAGRVEMIEGVISKRHLQSPGALPGRYRIYVENGQDGKQEFGSTRGLFEAAPAGGHVRLYYLPQSRLVVNSERLTDPPIDELTLADFVEDGPPPLVRRLDPSGLRDAIVGTWTSPLVTVTFGPNGVITAQMGRAGNQTGRWSVGDDGLLHADLMGAPLAAEAYIAEGWLTLGIDGQWFRLQRSA